MTIDERLDRLTERHEALTQTVELMAHVHQEDFAKNQTLMSEIMESIGSLARIAQAHENRISGLESN